MKNTGMSLADGLLTAMKAERDGHSFYLMAANSTGDPKGRTVFETLAREELDHLQFLKKHYESVTTTGKLSDSARLGPKMELTGASPLFSEGIKKRVKEAHFEMSALSIGIQLELDAMNFYRVQAEQCEDPQAKDFYSELSAWETGHYQALLMQQEELKEEYWSQGGFSPF